MTKDELITMMQDAGTLKTPRMIEAFYNIDRADFVLDKLKDEAYEDYPLPIGYEATISQPSTVAFMLELLEPQKEDKILDIGSGSGWTTALLAYLAGEKGEVWGVDIVPQLVEFARRNLRKYNFANVRIAQAKEGVIGLPEQAPYAKILVSAAAENTPAELFGQLAEGGRAVIPIRSSVWRFDKVSDKNITKQEFFGFSFVPLK